MSQMTPSPLLNAPSAAAGVTPQQWEEAKRLFYQLVADFKSRATDAAKCAEIVHLLKNWDVLNVKHQAVASLRGGQPQLLEEQVRARAHAAQQASNSPL